MTELRETWEPVRWVGLRAGDAILTENGQRATVAATGVGKTGKYVRVVLVLPDGGRGSAEHLREAMVPTLVPHGRVDPITSAMLNFVAAGFTFGPVDRRNGPTRGEM